MKKILFFFLKFLLLFLLLFFTGRIFFLLYNADKLSGESFGHIALSFWYALRMDIATISYFLLTFTLLLLPFLFIKNKRWLWKIINTVSVLLLFLCSFINIADSALTSAWGTKISAKALSYLPYPEQIKESMLSVNYPVLLGFFVLQSVVFCILYLRYVSVKVEKNEKNENGILFSAISYLLLLFALITGSRGGTGHHPLGKINCYYSGNQTLNLSSINGFWNFMDIMVNKRYAENPYNYFDSGYANRIVKELTQVENDSTVSVLNTQRPNIIIILIEGFSAENVSSLGGEPGIAPYMDTLARNGILFTGFYSTGIRTEQGLTAVLSAFPAQPKFIISRETGKIIKLDNLAKVLKNNGYTLSFYSPYDMEYARTQEYLQYAGFDKIYNDIDFGNVKRTGWGAMDEFVFDFQKRSVKNMKKPFLSVIMTSTTHEPWNGDFEKIFTGNTIVDAYKNSVHYTDKSLYNYLKQAEKEEWFSNSLFLITADHAHYYPRNRTLEEPMRYKIPMLLYGGALKEKYRGTKYTEPASQTDIFATLAAQLAIKNNAFMFSKNLFNSTVRHFAFYTFDNGFGFIDRNDTIVFRHEQNKVLNKNFLTANDSLNLNQGKALLQVLMQKFYDLE